MSVAGAASCCHAPRLAARPVCAARPAQQRRAAPQQKVRRDCETTRSSRMQCVTGRDTTRSGLKRYIQAGTDRALAAGDPACSNCSGDSPERGGYPCGTGSCGDHAACSGESPGCTRASKLHPDVHALRWQGQCMHHPCLLVSSASAVPRSPRARKQCDKPMLLPSDFMSVCCTARLHRSARSRQAWAAGLTLCWRAGRALRGAGRLGGHGGGVQLLPGPRGVGPQRAVGWASRLLDPQLMSPSGPASCPAAVQGCSWSGLAGWGTLCMCMSCLA